MPEPRPNPRSQPPVRHETRSHLAVLGVVLAVLAAAFYAGYTHGVRFGLDLQGGLEVVLQAKPKKGQTVTAQDLQQSVKIIRNRVDKLGVAEPEIRTQGTDQIAIELPGVKDASSAADVVGSTAQLYFYNIEKLLPQPKKAFRSPYDLLKRAQDRVAAGVKQHKTVDENYLFDANKNLLAGPSRGTTELLQDCGDKCPGGTMPKGAEVLQVPPGETLLHGPPDRVPLAVDSSNKGKFDRAKGVYFLLKNQPGLSGKDIRNATPSTGQGGWITSIQFTGSGGNKFADVTAQIARQGALAGNNNVFAIVLDRTVISTPSIDYKQYPNGISGNSAEISGLRDSAEAQNLALVLNTGALPVEFKIVSKTQVSATLGSESLRQGLLAGAAGLAVVMVYLLLFYRFLGLIADIALLIYSFIFYSLIVGIPVTMTLPGIAGMILTIGVAADANIIIFERIREEYRAGRTVKAAITAGYSKGLKTIVDANAVTIITALVLFVVGSGTVRGFALLLLLGTVLSMFTAVAATYALLGLISDLPFMRKPFVIGATRKPMRFHFQWMKYRNVMFAWVAIVVIASAGLVVVKGLNLGIDFKSGTKFDVRLQQKTDVAGVRSTLVSVDKSYGAAKIVETKAPTGSKQSAGRSSFAIEVEKLAGSSAKQTASENAVRNALDKRFGIAGGTGTKAGFSVQTIGASFGRQIIQSAIIAVVFSLLLLTVYIALRFEGKYSIPVLIALVHDLLVAAGAYALTGREFNSATVAALLTILGYSLYDTVIVFDRVRENVAIMRKARFARIVDASLNEVLTRSINTTLVVLIPIISILLFGGATLRDFAFALMVGIFAGAYSSLIVAAPILSWLKEREPAWARRIPAVGYSGPAGAAAATATPAPDGASGNGVGNREDETVPAGSIEDAAEPASATPAHGRRDRRTRAQRRKS